MPPRQPSLSGGAHSLPSLLGHSQPLCPIELVRLCTGHPPMERKGRHGTCQQDDGPKTPLTEVPNSLAQKSGRGGVGVREVPKPCTQLMHGAKQDKATVASHVEPGTAGAWTPLHGFAQLSSSLSGCSFPWAGHGASPGEFSGPLSSLQPFLGELACSQDLHPCASTATTRVSPTLLIRTANSPLDIPTWTSCSPSISTFAKLSSSAFPANLVLLLGLHLGEGQWPHLPKSPGRNLRVVFKTPLCRVPSEPMSRSNPTPWLSPTCCQGLSKATLPLRLGISLPLHFAPPRSAAGTTPVNADLIIRFPASCLPWPRITSGHNNNS